MFASFSCLLVLPSSRLIAIHPQPIQQADEPADGKKPALIRAVGIRFVESAFSESKNRLENTSTADCQPSTDLASIPATIQGNATPPAGFEPLMLSAPEVLELPPSLVTPPTSTPDKPVSIVKTEGVSIRIQEPTRIVMKPTNSKVAINASPISHAPAQELQPAIIADRTPSVVKIPSIQVAFQATTTKSISELADLHHSSSVTTDARNVQPLPTKTVDPWSHDDAQVPIVPESASPSEVMNEPIPIHEVNQESNSPMRLSDGALALLDHSPSTSIQAVTESKNDDSIGQSNPVTTSKADEPADVQKVFVPYRSGQAIRLSSTIKRVRVDDPTVCQAIRLGATELTIIGNRVGSTKARILVVNPQTNQEEEIQLAIEVDSPFRPWSTLSEKVRKEVPEIQSRVDELPTIKPGLGELTTAIANLHPGANVQLQTNPGGELVVRGTVQDEDQARQILSLVRKVCLIPVVDQLVVE